MLSENKSDSASVKLVVWNGERDTLRHGALPSYEQWALLKVSMPQWLPSRPRSIYCCHTATLNATRAVLKTAVFHFLTLS